MVDIFRDPTKTLPKRDDQIVRIGMEENEISGRKSHIPTPAPADKMTISHIPNAGTKR